MVDRQAAPLLSSPSLARPKVAARATRRDIVPTTIGAGRQAVCEDRRSDKGIYVGSELSGPSVSTMIETQGVRGEITRGRDHQ